MFKFPQLLRLIPIAILCALLASSVQLQPAHADVAPPEPPHGANVDPGTPATHVRMQAETVLLEVSLTQGSMNYPARVTADFTMRNLGNQAEQLDVRFPLQLSYSPLTPDEYCKNFEYPSIEDFAVRVNGSPVSVTKSFAQAIDMRRGSTSIGQTVEIPCWAHFPVNFPSGQDVSIRVSYTTRGVLGLFKADNYVGYSYILQTGAGWNGTIGSADISLRLPYAANAMNVREVQPESGVLSGNDVHWHFDDFEPDRNIEAAIMIPDLWQRIAKENQNVQRNPTDGEAWGRLGKAYKESIMDGRGFRADPASTEMHQLSIAAYQKALALLPKDADWHYGFAELQCWEAEWDRFSQTDPGYYQAIHDCVEQLKLALDINPHHAKALELLQSIAQWDFLNFKLVDLSGAKPDYPVLTLASIPTFTRYPTNPPAASATPTPAPPTATQLTTLTQPATQPPVSTATITPSPKPAQASSFTPEPTKASPAPKLPICGGALLPALALLAWGLWKIKI